MSQEETQVEWNEVQPGTRPKLNRVRVNNSIKLNVHAASISLCDLVGIKAPSV